MKRNKKKFPRTEAINLNERVMSVMVDIIDLAKLIKEVLEQEPNTANSMLWKGKLFFVGKNLTDAYKDMAEALEGLDDLEDIFRAIGKRV